MADKPYAFRFWQAPESGTPDYITCCLEAQDAVLDGAFRPVLLDFESCTDWISDRDALWEMSKPRSAGRTADASARRLALFSDLLRLRLLSRHGGLWLDADTMPLPGLAALADPVAACDLVAGMGPSGRVINGVLAARPGSRVMQRCVTRLEALFARKKSAGDPLAIWGEYGSALLMQALVGDGSENCLILPFGTLIQHRDKTPFDPFDPAAEWDDFIPADALAISLYNNSMPPHYRALSAAELTGARTVFAQAYRDAMAGAPKALPPARRLDQSDFVLPLMQKMAATDNKLRVVDEKLKTRQQDIEEARAQRDAAKAQQAEARAQRADAQAKQADRNAALADARKSRDAALEKLNEFRTLRDQTEAKLTERNTQLAKIRGQRDAVQDKLTKRNDELDALRRKYNIAAAKLRAQGAPKHLPGKAARANVFTQIFNNRGWFKGGSHSGCGSSLRQTETLRRELVPLLQAHGVTTLLDAPCGDFNWMQHVDLQGIRYIGADIVPDLIAHNARYASDQVSFQVCDLVVDPLPKADCIMIRDCFSHLALSECQAALNNIAAADIDYLLITHFTDEPSNADISTGEFHRLNFRHPPFNFPAPLDFLIENHPNPRHKDKSLALWRVADLPEQGTGA